MTDHPSALVSVPVEQALPFHPESVRIVAILRAEAERRGKGVPSDLPGLHKDLWTAAEIIDMAEQGRAFDHQMNAMLAASQAAGVGEDDGARLLWNRFAVAHHESWDDEPNKAEYRQAAADVLALRAPSREPEGGAVELHLKLLDTLKPFAEVAEKLKHCHVVEICEPTPDNPSRNIIPMPREWFERAADDLEAIAIQMHGAGVLSEGQASKLTGLDRVEVRKLADALATREEAPAIPDDVRRLVEAARVVAFEDQGPDAIKALDVASEAFADRVPWEGEPYEEASALENPDEPSAPENARDWPGEEAPAFDLIEATVSKADGSNPRRVFVDRVEGRIYEIAPAEAVTADSLRSVSDETMRALLSCKDVGSGRAHLASIINALRAQPQAREDAQPEALTATQLADALDWFWNAALAASSERQTETAADVASVMVQGMAAVAHGLRESVTHPAPDALRVAVEALEPFAAFVTPLPKWMKDEDVVSAGSPLARKQLTFGDCRRAAESLAALQAEQKGGA